MKPLVNRFKTEEFAKTIGSQSIRGITFSNAVFFARYLGSHVAGESTRFLIWNPKIETGASVYIELFLPLSDLIYDKPDQHSNVQYYRFEMATSGPFAMAVIDHLPTGNKTRFGAFYQFFLVNEEGEKEIFRDPLAWSLPYGIYAPAEVYDIDQVLATRKDADYFAAMGKELEIKEDNRLGPSTNLLEIHPGTATMDGTLGSLAERYQQIALTVKNGGSLSPDQKNLLAFDGIELMPIDPVIEHPERHTFWKAIQAPKGNGSEITIQLRKPAVTNWGYDVVAFGCGAVNPSILSTGRPHELLDLIETLHNFPAGPIKIVLDVVYGHAHNQAQNILPEPFFAGPNKYGQNINFKHPLVRAAVLEMQRRKINWGFDGIRVDGSQDFIYYDAEQDMLLHDDEFLKQMSAVEQRVAGVTYKPWMIFEDGRPWPRDDWELAATCRAVTGQQKHPHQWAPTIFSYNTPYRYTYWVSKWWRLKELFIFGDKWISGCANHDTMRRGTQTDPETINANFLLGNSLKMVMDNAYNNPSTTLLMHGFLPGVPMDFLQALGNAPWSFVRNTDTGYAIKVVAEEAFFTEWQITDIEYRKSRFFKNLKNLGFTSLKELRRFAKALLYLIKATGYNPGNIADILNTFDPPFAVTGWDLRKLNEYATCWMADLHEYCIVDLHADYLDTRKASYNFRVREFRLRNPWLNQNFGPNDFLHYREPVDGAVIYYGYRQHKETGKEIIFLANMEGQPRQVTPTQFKLPIKRPSDWNVAVSTPSVRAKKIDQPLKLSISQGILFEKNGLG